VPAVSIVFPPQSHPIADRRSHSPEYWIASNLISFDVSFAATLRMR